MAWLGRTTWFQRVAMLLVLVSGIYSAAANLLQRDPHAGWFVLGLALTFFSFRRQILWRVRTRLLLTFFLFGIVPLVLIYAMLNLTALLLLGQFAGDRVKHDLDARIATLQGLALDLEAAAIHNAAPEMLDAIRQREARVGVVVGRRGAPVLQAGTAFSAAPPWLGPDFHGLFQSGESYYLGAATAQGDVTVFAWLPMDGETMASLAGGDVVVAAIFGDDGYTNMSVGGQDGGQISFKKKKDDRFQPIAAPPLQPKHNRWDTGVATLLTRKLRTPTKASANVSFAIYARPSRLLSGMLRGGQAPVIIGFTTILGGVFLVVELVSLISSALHTRTITRSINDLYRGTLQIAANDFEHTIPVRGHHQLSALAASFNDMTGRVRHYIGEMRKKDKLESELEIARQVQMRLFPRSVPELRTLEMAAVCLPGRVVSGDYYDFLRLDERFTAIVLGDVSGKGVSAALLMASIQSSLHAQLKFRGDAMISPSFVAILMKAVSQQLYESTPPEKYATFFCSVYDEEDGILRYTNCGHLKPILVRGGAAAPIEGDGVPVGLLPGASYEQFELQLHAGDLMAIFSDGVPEAENASQEEFGEERLGRLLVEHAAAPLEEIIRIVTHSVDQWSPDPDGRDDTTIVLLRRR
jgi:sigma-B regulation protein RsbU (phosphoserine phosphatase)